MYKLNDIVQFYNMHSYSLLSKKCSSCNGTTKIEYFDAVNKQHFLQCGSCYYGYSQDKVELPKSTNDAFVSFGKIVGAKININSGKVIYYILPFNSKENPLSKFFSTEDGKYSFLNSPDSNFIQETYIEEDFIIRIQNQPDSSEINIPDYEYNIKCKDEIYLSSDVWIKTVCKTCNDTDYVVDSNNNKIKCPYKSWHYANGHKEMMLQKGIVDNIYYTIQNNKPTTIEIEYFNINLFDNKVNSPKLSRISFNYDKINSKNKYFITKSLNEALFLLGDNIET